MFGVITDFGLELQFHWFSTRKRLRINTIQKMKVYLQQRRRLSRAYKRMLGPKLFQPECDIVLPVLEDHYGSTNSMDDILRELDKEKARIVIFKDIRKFRKSVTVVTGLQETDDAIGITKQLKTNIGTGGTYKDGQIVLQGDHREAVKNMLIRRGFNEGSIEVR
jgi:translation initiation factor 1